MILSQKDLRKAVKAKKIVFSPEIEEKQWGEASEKSAPFRDLGFTRDRQ